jgi:hypothetical protein
MGGEIFILLPQGTLCFENVYKLDIYHQPVTVKLVITFPRLVGKGMKILETFMADFQCSWFFFKWKNNYTKA